MQYLSVHMYTHSEWWREPGECSKRKIIAYRKATCSHFLKAFYMEYRKETSVLQIKDESAAIELGSHLFSLGKSKPI